ncbi:hypothetical protein GCM10025870_33190 [Agromyces marinus]|uniref:Aminopeptidase N n=1 Tax=Agromyces marinus TaxID=1389020 RepID=A0ABM8H609_9MICO|nr:hypothetical protein GCM10025870_33190 [Agromyces marinus]
MSARPDLTRAEAEERAALLGAPAYEVTLDLTGDDGRFRSDTLVHFTARPGASTFIEATTAELHEIVLNGRALDVASVSDGCRIRLDDLAAENELLVVSTRSTPTRAKGCTASSTPSTKRRTCTPSSPSPRRTASTRCSTSPT